MSGSVLTGRMVRRTRASRVLAVSALAAFSLLVTALPSQSAEGDGTVSAWGTNASGQLGNGTNVAHFTAAPVLNLGPVREIAGGRDFAFALKTDQTVASWGINDGGQLGDGTFTNRSLPVAVSGLTGIVEIAAGHYHSLAANAAGSVFAWGKNNNGQLGDGTTTRRSRPVAVGAGTLPAVRLLAGGRDPVSR